MSLAFANPLLLLALVAVALPILIHFLTRARPQRIRFPTFHLLQEAAAGQQALHRLRTWILLALRTLAVLAIVLWFARPFLRQADAHAAEASQRVVLILDASLSMRAVTGQRVTRFAQAQSEAAEVLKKLPTGSSAAVVLIGSTPRALLPALTQNLDALHDEMIRARPAADFGDPASALAFAKKLLGATGTIYVFSDFQRTNWERVRFDALAGLSIKLRSVATQPIDNVALTGVKVTGDEVSATLFNATAQPRPVTVRCELDNAPQEISTSVPAFSTREVAFRLTVPANPFPLGKITLTGADDLPDDDVRYFRVRAPGSQRALVLSDTDRQDRRSSAFFLHAALAAGDRLKVERRLAHDADRRALEDTDLFVLIAPVTLPADAADILQRRVLAGVRLIVWLDGPTAPAVVGSLSGLQPPFRLTRPVAGEAMLLPPTGPLRGFADPEQADLTTLRFRRHYATELGGDAEVVARFADGAAALVLAPAGKGHALWANLPVTPDATDLPGHPAFPALLHELVRALTGATDELANAPGVPWQIPVENAAGDLLIVGPDGATLKPTVVPGGLALPAVDAPGHYLVKRGDQVVAVGTVNIDSRESDVRPTALPEITGTNVVATIVDEAGLSPTQPATPLWPKLAGSAAALGLLEMMLLALWPAKVRRR